MMSLNATMVLKIACFDTSYTIHASNTVYGTLCPPFTSFVSFSFPKTALWDTQMQKKISNVIDCLKTEPLSKRAIIPIPFNSEGSETVDWTNQGQNKCCRELHFYIEDGKLKCTGIVRMQNANIFVKNIHFFATVIDHVASELKLPVGEYTHWITNLCLDRTATSC